MTSKLSDDELWDATVSDSSRAFIVLYNRYWKKIYKTACYYLKDEAAAEEIVHDVFVALWTRRKFSRIENFGKYIHMTARYHAFKQLKAARMNCIEYLDEVPPSNDLLVYNTANHKLDYEDLKSALETVLQEVPGRCREIFWLSRIEQLSNQEIADRLNISKRTVENQITLTLKYLRVSYPQMTGVALVVFMII